MLMFPFRYLKAQVMLKLQPEIEVPPELPALINATLNRAFERERMKEEWAEIRNASRAATEQNRLSSENAVLFKLPTEFVAPVSEIGTSL